MVDKKYLGQMITFAKKVQGMKWYELILHLEYVRILADSLLVLAGSYLELLNRD